MKKQTNSFLHGSDLCHIANLGRDSANEIVVAEDAAKFRIKSR